jgi:hypothetical protein
MLRTCLFLLTRDGRISLLPGTEVIIFALNETAEGILFDSKTFSAADKQKIILQPGIVSKREFNRAVKRFGVKDVKISVETQKTPMKYAKWTRN